jgi:hypothetical protein
LVNVCRVGIRVCVVIGLCALSRDAWAQRETGPYGNLFGGQPNGDVNQTLSLRWSAYGGQDDVIREQAQQLAASDDRYRNNGDYGGLSGQVAYTRGAAENRFSVFGSTDARAYGALRDIPMPTFSTGTSFRVAAGKRTSLRGTFSGSLAPYAQFAPYITAGSSSSEMVPFSYGFAVENRRSLGFGGDFGIVRQLSKRSTLGLDGVWQRGQFERGASSENRTARVMLTQAIANGFGVHGGYGYQDARFAFEDTPAATVLHNLDIGVDFNRALSVSRKTRVSFGTGSSIVRPAGGGSQYFLNGQATLEQGIGRTWTALAGYNRSSHFAQGFRDLLFLDAFSAGLGGQLATRVRVSSNASYSFGTVGLGAGAPSVGSYTGSARLGIALSRLVALTASYTYYAYDAPPTATTIPGIAGQLNRQALMIGLSGWIPFINDVRPRRDSR